jgi:hypothetical protein
MSSKKPFEYIEEKIKQAAENNLPSFDEKAWEAMNAKLDKEEKRRRPFFLWWILLPLFFAAAWGGYKLLGSSADPAKQAVVIARTNNKNKNEGEAEKSTAIADEKYTGGSNFEKSNVLDNTAVATTDDIKKPAEPGAIVKAVLPADEKGKDLKIGGSNTINKTGVAETGDNKMVAGNNVTTALKLVSTRTISGKRKGKMIAHVSGNDAGEVDGAADENTITKNDKEKPTDVIGNQPSTGQSTVTTAESKPLVAAGKNNEPVMNKPAPEIKDSSATEKPTTVTKKNDKQQSKKLKRFYLLATGGTDAGSTKLFSYKNSSITPKFGIGLGYQFNDKFSVQTGFYASNKKYLAFKGDYHVKPGSYWDRVDMINVHAACLVYEIPFTFRYNFVQHKSFTFYATAGASSYIMQTEDYDYHYNAYNVYYEKQLQYTGNRHLFSTLTFSAGIEKKLSDKFSLLAEPSFSVPLTGVGDGKVKLYSSALQAGFRYFLSKK